MKENGRAEETSVEKKENKICLTLRIQFVRALCAAAICAEDAAYKFSREVCIHVHIFSFSGQSQVIFACLCRLYIYIYIIYIYFRTVKT